MLHSQVRKAYSKESNCRLSAATPIPVLSNKTKTAYALDLGGIRFYIKVIEGIDLLGGIRYFIEATIYHRNYLFLLIPSFAILDSKVEGFKSKIRSLFNYFEKPGTGVSCLNIPAIYPNCNYFPISLT